MLIFLFTINVNAQIEIRPYEQIAIDYFANEIITSYTDLKYFILKRNLEATSSVHYSFCMPLKEVSNYKAINTTKINPPYPQVIEKLSFFKKLFTSKKKIGNLHVFKYYPKDSNIIVVIFLSRKYIDDYYSILIVKKSKKVIDYCKETYYE